MLALQASPTKCTGSLSKGALSSPWWLLVRTHASVCGPSFTWVISLCLLQLVSKFPSAVRVCEWRHSYTQGTCPKHCSVNCWVREGGHCIAVIPINLDGWSSMQRHLEGIYLEWHSGDKNCRQSLLKFFGCGGWQQAKTLSGWSVPIWKESISLGQNHFLWGGPTEFVFSVHLRIVCSWCSRNNFVRVWVFRTANGIGLASGKAEEYCGIVSS